MLLDSKPGEKVTPAISNISFPLISSLVPLGRGGNLWLSPKGCMMFSLPLHFPSSTRLSQQTSILQHIVALAIVSAIRTHPGYEVWVCVYWNKD